jgi:hypothetical protein
MERLELSKQKLLGPKSSASTNFATSVLLYHIVSLLIISFFWLKYFFYLKNIFNVKFENKSLNLTLKIYSFSSVYKLYIKLVVLPRSIDFAKDKDFWAALYPFLFQFAFLAFFFDFDVRFLGTAIIYIYYL